MELLLIGLLSTAVLATVVLLVAWMFARAQHDGYLLGEDGQVKRPEVMTTDTGEPSPAEESQAPTPDEPAKEQVDYLGGIKRLPQVMKMSDEGTVDDSMPFVIVRRSESASVDFVNTHLNEQGGDAGLLYVESEGVIDVRSSTPVTVTLPSGESVIESVQVIPYAPSGEATDGALADTIYGVPLLGEVSECLQAVIRDNPRVKPMSKATISKVSKAYAELYPASESEVTVTVVGYRISAA